MTANELADEVMEHYKAEAPRGFNVNWMEEVATMLRKQAQEIKNCNMDIDALRTFNNDLEQEIEALKLRKLTDEEIDHTWFNHGWGSVEKDDLMKFARAILKKASEK
jgi:hypothetical protein